MIKKQFMPLLIIVALLSSCEGFGGTSSSAASSSPSTSSSVSSSQKSSSPSSQNSSSSVSSASDSSNSASTSTPSEPTLIWSDEFDGDAVDSRNWSYQLGTGSGGWGNNEAEYYRSENSTVENGNLVIAAKKEDYGGRSYTSSRLRTYGHFATTYGRVEARISLPAVAGMWPAFWMMPVNNYLGQGWPFCGEIDIMEAKGRIPTSSSGALHWSKLDGHIYMTNSQKYPNNSTIEDYHVYAIDWSSEKIVWSVDGVSFLTVKKEFWHPSDPDKSAYKTDDDAPFNQPFYIIFNMAIGGNFDGGILPPDDSLPCTMKVDYVRVYHNN